MRQKFFTSTIQGRFIKALLHNTYLPIYNTISYGDYVIKDFIYIYKKTLLKCEKSGIFGETAKLNTVSHYDFGEKYIKFTEKFQSSYQYYDSKTHEWLGKYLRCYRDIYDIDLMPFYNCFSNTYIPNVVIRDDGIITTVTKDYKVVQIPIKFNKKYTIALDCSSDVMIAPAVLRSGDFVTVTTSTAEINLTNRLCEINIKRLNNLTFKNPFVYEVLNRDSSTEGFYQKYEKDLYLLIQIPQNNYSSIVVLEGDFSNSHNNVNKVINAEELEQLSIKQLNELFIGNLSLLQLSDGNAYPFADRLIEYLLWNTITHLDEIGNNIERVQEYSKSFDINAEFIPGVWDNYLRYLIYLNYSKDKKSKHLDINGYVDKDVEKFLLRSGV